MNYSLHNQQYVKFKAQSAHHSTMGPHTNGDMSDSHYAFTSESIIPQNLTLWTGFKVYSNNHYTMELQTNSESYITFCYNKIS